MRPSLHKACPSALRMDFPACVCLPSIDLSIGMSMKHVWPLQISAAAPYADAQRLSDSSENQSSCSAEWRA